ncbi:ATP-binding protein [Bombiscardovia coagulans]
MRPKHGRVFCGVCQGISLHLGVNVLWIRLIMIGLTPAWGIGLVAYIFLWICIPSGDPVAAAQTVNHNPAFAPLSRGNTPFVNAAIEQTQDNASKNSDQDTGLTELFHSASKPALLAGIGTLLLTLAFFIQFNSHSDRLLLPAIFLGAGIVSAWLRFGGNNHHWWTLPLSASLILAALAAYVFPSFPWTEAWQMMALALAVLAAVAVILTPWAGTLLQRLSSERAEKEREEERADIAAHLHDGVLQTLALIQLHASEPQTVFTLARGQERDLREWLYQERTPSERSVSSGLKLIAADIEDTYSKPIDIVTVGDALPSAQTDALLDATQQALINAVTHGSEPISAYCEASTDKVEIFVRDHGEGFELEDVPLDRLGIRQSIIGRIERRGGTVEIVSKPHWGTEVRMHMPISASYTGSGSSTNISQPQGQH